MYTAQSLFLLCRLSIVISLEYSPYVQSLFRKKLNMFLLHFLSLTLEIISNYHRHSMSLFRHPFPNFRFVVYCFSCL